MRSLVLPLALSAALVTGAPAFADGLDSTAVTAACKGAGSRPTPRSGRVARRATACVLNAVRAQAGLPALQTSPKLGTAARKYARLMATRDFFGHVSPAGTGLADRVRDAGYTALGHFVLGEALYWGSGGGATPRSAVRAWLASPPHRAIILDPAFRQAGFGVAYGAPQPVRGRAATYVLDVGAVVSPTSLTSP